MLPYHTVTAKSPTPRLPPRSPRKTGLLTHRETRKDEAVPRDVKSYRITRDRAGRWHVAFAVIPEPITGPDNGETVGIDRGVAVSAALSTGEMLTAPGLSAGRKQRLTRLQRRLARARPRSNRRSNRTTR
jgi:putative transposase